MAAQIPAALKNADITRFAHRAAQLESAKPVVAYWCDYWIVNQILSKGLHNADEECLAYTTNLMDKLEKVKAENSTNDAVVDDVAGKAYIEQFGLETFQRADNAVRANKASRQTADTFQASATFLDLLQIWGPVEPEITAKIKYAKFHALRIAKALKAGEDPNLSNPVQEPEPEEELPTLDPNDAEVQAINGTRQPTVEEVPDDTHITQRHLAQSSILDQSLHPSRAPSQPPPQDSTSTARQPSVADVPDESHRLQSRLAPQSNIDQSLHPSRAPSVPRQPQPDVSPLLAPSDSALFYHNPNTNNNEEISPISTNDRRPSAGGNYFPPVPHPTATPGANDLPSAPSEPTLPEPPTTFTSPNQHYHPFPAVSPTQTQPPPQHPHPHLYQSQPLSHPTPSRAPPQPNQTQPQPPPQPLSQPPTASVAPPASTEQLALDEEKIIRAQKHARWAISALNFEDVPTAIRELRGALEVLGAK